METSLYANAYNEPLGKVWPECGLLPSIWYVMWAAPSGGSVSIL